jgi:hypothetical protein
VEDRRVGGFRRGAACRLFVRRRGQAGAQSRCRLSDDDGDGAEDDDWESADDDDSDDDDSDEDDSEVDDGEEEADEDRG